MGISHISLATGPARFAAVRAFYLAALAPLGYTAYIDRPDDGVLGLRPRDGPPDFWLHAGNGEQPDAFTAAGGEGAFDVEKRPGRAHVAFGAENPEVVDRWFEGAVKAGGISNGAPGLRKYAATYYAAFVLDPLGNNIEVLYYSPETATTTTAEKTEWTMP
ncbi:hypothetical protein SLS62_006286 [Diatrype stigma]|uniref:VOC domain-containing protein n=1 Tax=Diatrype stigma TaxID=117547 RepID=A0AAN9UNF4_9PEZI